MPEPEISISNLKYFITRFGQVDYNLLISDYKGNIEQSVQKSVFIPNHNYIRELLYSDAYISIIYDEFTFNNFISDIQSITLLYCEESLEKFWNEKRLNKLLFFVFSPNQEFIQKIKNHENNILSNENLSRIRVEIMDIPKGDGDPQKAIHYSIKVLQLIYSKDKINSKRGSGLTKSKEIKAIYRIFNE